MTTLEQIQRWRDDGSITGAQYDAIRAILIKERFSVFLELNALLYLGALALAAGLAWTAQTHFERLGDPFILGVLTAVLGGCLYYCFSRGLPFSKEETESPNLVFDYVLYTACLVLSVELGYIESRFDLLGASWDHYLLFAAAVFFGLAYRFDNRLVLSLALSSLAGWFGLRFSRLGVLTADSVRIYALIYGGLAAGTGWWLYTLGLKKHFFETYLHVAVNVVFAALLSGLHWELSGWIHLAALIGLCFLAASIGLNRRRFAFAAYGIVYGYAGISYQLLSRLNSLTTILVYFLVTGSAVVIWLVRVARTLAHSK